MISGDLGVADRFRLGIPADQEPALIVTPESLHAFDEAAIFSKVASHRGARGRVCKLRDDVLDLAHFRPQIPIETLAPSVDDRSHRAQNGRGQEIDARVGLTGERDLERQAGLRRRRGERRPC